MKTVSVSELKARLSYYLKQVRRGSEIQVLDRGLPIARLTQPGTPAGSDSDRRQRLASAGVLRIGTGRMAAALRARPLDLGVSLSGALRLERGDRV